MEFKVGDRIKVVNNNVFNDEIKSGDVGVIAKDYKAYFEIHFDKKFKDIQYLYKNEIDDNIIKVKEKIKLIFNDNATILILNGKKYVTKCDENDTYDKEKGLLICLANANGYKYNDIQELLNNAIEQTPKVEKKKIENKSDTQPLNDKVKDRPKYKITLSEFWVNKNKVNMCIHCDTEEKAKKLLNAFDKLGQKWCDGESYISSICWDCFKEETCYTNNNNLSRTVFYEKDQYKIYKFEEVDLKN